MSKVLPASCVAGIVTAESFPVATAEILSEGVGASDGVLLMDEDYQAYVTSNASDIKTTLEKLSDALDKISTAITSLDTRGFLVAATAGVPGPPLLAATVIQITAIKAEVDVLTETLK